MKNLIAALVVIVGLAGAAWAYDCCVSGAKCCAPAAKCCAHQAK